MTPFQFGRMQIISHAACLNNRGESEQGDDVNFSTFPTHMGFLICKTKIWAALMCMPTCVQFMFVSSVSSIWKLLDSDNQLITNIDST